MSIRRTSALSVACAGTTAAAALATVIALGLAAPAGAQLLAFEPAGVNVVLTGSGVAPAVGTRAVGECNGHVDPARGELGLTCSSNVENAGALLLFAGQPGAGTQLANLGQGRVVTVQRTLSDADMAAILTGQAWVAVASPDQPGGEIGAQLLPRPASGERVMLFPLREDSLVYTGSGATGHCALRVSDGDSQVDLLCTHNVANARQLRLIIDGGTVETVTGVRSPFEATLPAIADSFDRFLDGNFGVVLTSSRYPNGEIGMVLDKCIDSPTTLCLSERRFRVTVDFTAPGRSAARATSVPARTGDAGLFSFFDPANWEVLVKVLRGCQLNQSFWVYLSANTDVAFTITVYDTLTGRTRTFNNPQGRIASPVADTSAFPCS